MTLDFYKKRILLFSLVILILTESLFSQTDTLNLYFDIDIYALNKNHKELLNAKLYKIDSINNYIIYIEGSADYLGTEEYNQSLSENRAKEIADYLKSYFKVDSPSIIYKGIGEQIKGDFVDEENTGIQKDRSVKVILKKKDISQKFVVGESFVLKNLQFEPGRHILRPFAIAEREKLLNIMLENPTLEIEIQGHVCCGAYIGDADHLDYDTNTYNLSETRAKSIYGYLIRNGINAERLSYKGFAFDKPLIFPEKSSEDAYTNRRVEIKIVKI